MVVVVHVRPMQERAADGRLRARLASLSPYASGTKPMSETVILRRKVTSNFTVLDNAIIQDKRLSWKALGLLVRLLSYPPNFKLRLVTLSRERASGRDATRSGLKELEMVGYLAIVRERAASGKYATTTWIINDQPSKQTMSENPNVVKPSAANTTSEKPTLVSTDVKQVLSIQKTTTPTSVATPVDAPEDYVEVSVPADLEVVRPVISHLPPQVQQDIVDEIEGKRRRGVLRASPIGLAKHFAANPGVLVLSDGIEVRRERERALQIRKVDELEAQRRKSDNEMLALGLARMTDQEFESMCSKLPPRIRERIAQQRAGASTVRKSTTFSPVEK